MTDLVANIGIALQQRAQSDARRVRTVLVVSGGAS
jgi:hypothetical protein